MRARASIGAAWTAMLLVAACSGASPSATSGGADGGASSDSGSSVTSPGNDAGSGVGPDASKNDAQSPQDSGPQTNGWTQEAQSTEYTYLASVSGLVADPTSPRHLLVELESNTSVLLEWKNGTASFPLVAGTTGTAAEFDFVGGGFDGNGGLFAYYGGFPGGQSETPFKLATASSGGSWSWTDMPPPLNYPTWPPRSFAIGAASSAREVLYSDVALWDITGKTGETQTLTWPNWQTSALTPTAEGGFNSLAFVPNDSTTFLVTMMASAIVHRCTFATELTCDASQTTGFPAGASLGAIAIASSDPNRVTVFEADSNVAHLYSSTDGGVTFASVPLQTWPAGFQMWAVSPTAPDTIAIYLPPYEDSSGKSYDDQLVFTKDDGAHWNPVALPDTPTTDVDAFVFDAAGTLFLSRGSTLFSKVL